MSRVLSHQSSVARHTMRTVARKTQSMQLTDATELFSVHKRSVSVIDGFPNPDFIDVEGLSLSGVLKDDLPDGRLPYLQRTRRLVSSICHNSTKAHLLGKPIRVREEKRQWSVGVRVFRLAGFGLLSHVAICACPQPPVPALVRELTIPLLLFRAQDIEQGLLYRGLELFLVSREARWLGLGQVGGRSRVRRRDQMCGKSVCVVEQGLPRSRRKWGKVSDRWGSFERQQGPRLEVR